MAEIGYWLASEEHAPMTMVRAIQQAEPRSFPYVLMSDHFHPWTGRQGQSPFVWSVIARYRGQREDVRRRGTPQYVELQVCVGEDEEKCRRLVHDLWKTSGVGGQIAQELRRPADFEAAAEHVTLERSTKHTPVGPDVEPYVDAVRQAADAGFDHIGLHQVGPDQDAFFVFWERELRPALAREKVLSA